MKKKDVSTPPPIRSVFPSPVTALFAALCLCGVPALHAETKWRLVFSDEFNGTALDESKWSRTPAQSSAWNQYMDPTDPKLVAFEDGCIVLKGTKKTADANERDYREAGIWSLGKYTFQYGKVEFRAKFDSIQGVWPALWLMSASGKTWPLGGEIDVMEHLNYQGSIYQTIHMGGKDGVATGDNSFGVTPGIDKTVFNTYGVEWSPGKIVFFVNGVETETYTPENTSEEYWPFDEENSGFYLILSMQIGGSWVENTGENRGIDAATIYESGAKMHVDYVRVWQDAAMIPEPAAVPALFGAAAAVLAAFPRRRRSRSRA